jgi:hypothetical protein
VAINDTRVEIRQDLAPCAYQVNPRLTTIEGAGGARTANVSVATGCPWTASSNVSWIAVTAGATGDGNGAVSMQVAPSSGPERSGTVTIAGQTFTVNQGDGCTYTAQPSAISIAAGGGSRTIDVTSGSGCAWTSSSQAPWITITSGSGSGNGSATLNIAASAGSARNGTVQVAGRTITVSQGSGCAFGVDPASASFGAAGAGGSIAVTTDATCAWTAASSDSWIIVTAGSAGQGNGSVGYTVAANSGPARNGTLTVGGNTIAITQASGCAFGVQPTSVNVAAGPGGGAINVTTEAGCEWEAVSQTSWIGVAAGSTGNGNGTVTYTIGANNGPDRAGTLLVAGQTVTITQANGCSYGVTPLAVNVPVQGATGISIGVSTAAGCPWEAFSNDNWIGVTSGASGEGSGSVGILVVGNSGAARNGTLTVAGRTVSVAQAGCSFTLTPTSATFGPGGGSGSTAVTTSPTCEWTASETESWLSITSGASGTGSGTVAFSVQSTTGSARTGVITIGGQTFTVQQSGCSYSINPTSTSIGAAGGNGNFALTTTNGCTWTATPSDSWIAISGSNNGNQSATINFTVQPNVTPARTGTISVGNQTFTVNQASGCNPLPSPTVFTGIPASGGQRTLTVSAGQGCAWTVSLGPNSSFLTIPAPPANGGSGNGSINFTITANTGPQRTGSLVLGTQTINVTQVSGCTFTLTPPGPVTYTNAGGAGSITVTTNAGCTWTATQGPNSTWITILPPVGSTVSYTVAPQLSGKRSGSIVIGNGTVSVTFIVNQGS